MAKKGSSPRQAREHAKKAARKASPWIEGLARSGYVAKGVFYAAIGVIAAREAAGAGGLTTGGGVMKSIGAQPFGRVLLVVLAAGLIGYAAWKLVQGIMDPEDKGRGAVGLIRRVSYVGSGVLHGTLAFVAAQEVFDPEGGSDAKDDLTAQVLAQPLGQWLVAVVGLIVLSVGFYQFSAAINLKFRDELKLEEISRAEDRWIMLSGSVGTTARALIIGIAGAFVVLAAYQADPSETRGLGGALATLARQPFGPYLLGAAAFGFIAYAVFMLFVARYRAVEPH